MRDKCAPTTSTQLAAVDSTMSVSASSSSSSPASKKPWFLTFDPSNKSVLIWRNNQRLKVDGSSAGEASEISIIDDTTDLLMISFVIVLFSFYHFIHLVSWSRIVIIQVSMLFEELCFQPK